jgi:3-oxoacyl-[acyl-carrier protein] reductase
VSEGNGRFAGQVALVTGAARGIGKGIALSFAGEGAMVGLADLEEARLLETAQAIRDQGGSCLCLPGDVRDLGRMQEVAQELATEGERLDVLVCSAGIIRDTLTATMDPEQWQDVIATNLTGTYTCAKAVLRLMMRQRHGRIINISSVSSMRGRRGQANYAASKGGVEAFTRVLALEVASKNVTVNAICPGIIETEMTEAIRAMSSEPLEKRVPLRRLGQPEDIARAAMFLASEEGAYITGQTIVVDGGLSLGLGF